MTTSASQAADGQQLVVGMLHQAQLALHAHGNHAHDGALVEVAIQRDVRQLFAGVPFAVLVDVDVDQIVIIRIHMLRRLQGGDDGNVVLTGAAAVYERQSDFHDASGFLSYSV